MAVTIDELHIQVQEAAPPAQPAAAQPEEPKRDLDLSEALKLHYERKSRLCAD